MVGMGRFQLLFHLTTLLTPRLWWALNMVILVWWLGKGLLNLLALGQHNVWCLITLLPWVHGQVVINYLLPVWSRVYGLLIFLTKQLHNLRIVLIPSSPTLSKHQNLMYPLMSLITWHLQFLWDSYAWLALFFIILNCSLLLASNLMNFDARLGCYLYLYYWQTKCQPLHWLAIFPVIQGHLGWVFFTTGSYKSHWIMSIKETEQRLSDFQTGIGVAAHG